MRQSRALKKPCGGMTVVIETCKHQTCFGMVISTDLLTSTIKTLSQFGDELIYSRYKPYFGIFELEWLFEKDQAKLIVCLTINLLQGNKEQRYDRQVNVIFYTAYNW